jgi:hypothetical protein
MSKTRKAKSTAPEIGTFKISDLRIPDDNPRTISPEALDGLMSSVRRFGIVEPIIVNVKPARPRVVGGCQRLRVLQRLGVEEVICVKVSCTRPEEKLLNLTLNNPQIQGTFTETALAQIRQLSADLKDDRDLVDLKIAELRHDLESSQRRTLGPSGSEAVDYHERTLRPYKRVHVLLSFAPELFGKLKDHLEVLAGVEGVEYEQGAN